MSFGWSATDIANLVKVAYTTIQNCRKACGEYDELTRQVHSLHGVLKKLQNERANPESLLNREGESTWDDLRPNIEGSRDILQALNAIVKQYAGVSRKDRGVGRLWQRTKFGNKELGDLNDLRQKARFYTQAILLHLSTITVGSLGRIESSLDEAGLKDLKPAVEEIAKKLASSNRSGGSVLTVYPNDDTAVWKEVRRECIKAGGPSHVISKNMNLIIEFIKKLGERGVLDEREDKSRGDRRDSKSSSEISYPCALEEKSIVESPISHDSLNGSEDQDKGNDGDSDIRDDTSDDSDWEEPPMRRPSSSGIFRFSGPSNSHFSAPRASDADRVLKYPTTPRERGEKDIFPYIEHWTPSNRTSKESRETIPLSDPGSDGGAGASSTGDDTDDVTSERLTVVPRFRAKLTAEGLVLHRKEAHAPELLRNAYQDESWLFGVASTVPGFVFLGTPWGFCMVMDSINVTLLLQNLEFINGVIDQCLNNADSRLSLGNPVLFAGESPYNDEEDLKTLKMFKVDALSLLHRLSDIDVCARRNFYHIFHSGKRKEVARLLKMETGTLSPKFWFNCGDSVLRLLGRRSLPQMTDNGILLWDDGRPPPPRQMPKTDHPSAEKNATNRPVQESEERPQQRLEEIIQHYERDFLPRAEKFVQSPARSQAQRLSEYVALNEEITREILLELDTLSGDNGASFRKMRKAAVQTVQDMLDELEKLG